MSKATKSSMKLPLFLIIGPTVGFFASLLLYAIINFAVSNSSSADSSQLFGEQPIFITISNTLLYILGAISTITFLPCLVIGIILYNKWRGINSPTARANHGDRSWEDIE